MTVQHDAGGGQVHAQANDINTSSNGHSGHSVHDHVRGPQSDFDGYSDAAASNISGPAAVGRLLRSMREGAGLTQEGLARASRCSKAYLSLVESGQRTLSPDRARAIEAALNVHDGRLLAALQWQRVPEAIRAQVELTQSRSAAIAHQLQEALDSSDPLGAMRDLRDLARSNIEAPRPLRRNIPIINKVAAGYPREFTDLDYPAAVADEYLACPDVADPDAFAARVVGDSMSPAYAEGDVVVFSPQAPVVEGGDCFVRLERDGETTFKRVYFIDEGRTIRLQPLNSAYAAQMVSREDVTGLYPAVYVLRKVNGS